MVSSIGMTDVKWQQLQTEYLNQNSPARRNYSTNALSSSLSGAQTDEFVSSKGNTCTDGVDDGKIGVASALGNIVEGAGKSIINGIKGAFTDSEGNFSILKTLGTIGVGAACVAFPAVGLVLAGVGVVTGGAKLATGVANAMNAETDAEAKDAWEQVGEGGLTAGLSAVGVKASLGAVQSSSTAGALASFKQSSTLSQNPVGYAKALGQDMVSSTVNNFNKIKSSATTLAEGARLYKLRKDVKNQNGALTADELNQQRNLDALEAFSPDEVKLVADNMSQLKTNLQNNATQIGKQVKNTLSPKNIGTKITDALQKEGGQSLITKLRTEVANNGGLVKTITSKFTSTQKSIYTALVDEGANYNQIVSQFGYENVIGVLEVLGSYNLLNESI